MRNLTATLGAIQLLPRDFDKKQLILVMGQNNISNDHVNGTSVKSQCNSLQTTYAIFQNLMEFRECKIRFIDYYFVVR